MLCWQHVRLPHKSISYFFYLAFSFFFLWWILTNLSPYVLIKKKNTFTLKYIFKERELFAFNLLEYRRESSKGVKLERRGGCKHRKSKTLTFFLVEPTNREEVKSDPLTPPKVERATEMGMIHDMTPSSFSPNVWDGGGVGGSRLEVGWWLDAHFIGFFF